MSSLTEVVKHLQTQNQTLEDVAASVKSMLSEDVKARLALEEKLKEIGKELIKVGFPVANRRKLFRAG
jgi:hypothetical protein